MPTTSGAESPPPGSAEWWLARRTADRRLRRSAVLSTGRIIDEALLIVEREGAGALTMRRVADALGVTQSSLYGHVANRQELMVLLADEVLRLAVASPPSELNWQESLMWSSSRLRDQLLARPNLLPLLRGSQGFGPNARRVREDALRVLLDAGFSPENAIKAYAAVATFVFGSLLRSTGANPGEPDGVASREALFRSGTDGGSLVAEHAAALARVSNDDIFEAGLGAIIAGLSTLR
jgi:TetR/AcrR family transcriptional regulator, tetracycline repressor protein